MKEFKVQPMNMEVDKPQVLAWDNEFSGKPEYESIEKFVLENGLIRGLSELIETNYERYPIGIDETKNIVTIKSNENEIIGFLIFQLFEITTKKPSMYLQYIVINPKYQHQNYGKEILREIFTNSKQHLGYKPKDVFCIIDNQNFASQKLFLDFGFNLAMQPENQMYKASANMSQIEHAIEQMSWQ